VREVIVGNQLWIPFAIFAGFLAMNALLSEVVPLASSCCALSRPERGHRGRRLVVR